MYERNQAIELEEIYDLYDSLYVSGGVIVFVYLNISLGCCTECSGVFSKFTENFKSNFKEKRLVDT